MAMVGHSDHRGCLCLDPEPWGKGEVLARELGGLPQGGSVHSSGGSWNLGKECLDRGSLLDSNKFSFVGVVCT